MIHPNNPTSQLDGLDDDFEAGTPIPDEDDYAGSGSQTTTWRIAAGVICRGSESATSKTPYEVRQNKNGKSLIIGKLIRYSVEEGHYKDGNPFHVLEADFETARGNERLRINLLNMEGQFKPGGVVLRLAQGLAHFKTGDLVCIEPFLGSEPNKFNKKPTFINIGWYDARNRKSNPVPKVPRSDTEFGILVSEALEALKKGPGYKERPKVADSGSHYGQLCTWLTEKGRQGPDQAPAVWLKFMQLATQNPGLASLSSVSDHQWGEMRQFLAAAATLPASIPLVEKPAATVAASLATASTGAAIKNPFGDEYDPFGDD